MITFNRELQKNLTKDLETYDKFVFLSPGTGTVVFISGFMFFFQLVRHCVPPPGGLILVFSST